MDDGEQEILILIQTKAIAVHVRRLKYHDRILVITKKFSCDYKLAKGLHVEDLAPELQEAIKNFGRS